MEFVLLLLIILQPDSGGASKTGRLAFLLPEELVFIRTTAQLWVEPHTEVFVPHYSPHKQPVCASLANILTLFIVEELMSTLTR